MALKETDAYPAMPEDGYGWEKLFSERMCRHFKEDYGIDTKVARYHNVYGPHGTYKGGREKAPAALTRKIIEAKKNKLNEIDVWGDGNQERSFLYIDDCIDGTLKLYDSDKHGPFNIGSSELVSINQMIDVLQKISNYEVQKKYLLDKPKGVMGRNSDNTLIKRELNWQPKISLEQGLMKTYNWIESEMQKMKIYLNKNKLKRFHKIYEEFNHLAITIGLNANHADSSICVFDNNKLIFALEEERINRIKHWAGVPLESIRYALNYCKINPNEINNITFNTNPFSNIDKNILLSQKLYFFSKI